MRLHVVVRGRVQGVGFRWFVREAARRRNIAGWVRNLANGAVEVNAEGSAQDIDALRAELVRGPAGASVERVEEVDGGEDDMPMPFAINR